jgi:ligand-binding SRPBCC domain-containing protein
MRTFELDASVWVPAPIEEVFAFFSQAENLERLTPAFLKFRILTPMPVVMGEGTTLDYRILLHGVPITWRSEITQWQPVRCFVDEQRRGPYRRWKHTHTFEASNGGTIVGDHVEYAVWGGSLVNRLFVAPELARIFAFRRTALLARFTPRAFSLTGKPLE